jgi:hypothetical protein
MPKIEISLSDDTKQFLTALFNPQPVTPEPVTLEPEPKRITLTEIRETIQIKGLAGKTEKLKEILKSFGASKVSEINETDYPIFFNQISNV